jgi:hypothetical protein
LGWGMENDGRNILEKRQEHLKNEYLKLID